MKKQTKKAAKVYVLQAKYHGTWDILGVFSSKAKADEAVAWILEHDMYFKSRPNDLGVSTYELNGERIG